jgi:predicted HTH domain antitoxin
MTTATRLIQQGIQEGMQQGILEGKKEDVAKLYQKGKFSFEMIAELLELNLDFVKQTLKEKKLIS